MEKINFPNYLEIIFFAFTFEKTKKVMAKKKTPEEIIVAYMQENGIMYKWLSEKTDISQSHLCNILRTKGENKKTLTPENKDRIAKALGITLN